MFVRVPNLQVRYPSLQIGEWVGTYVSTGTFQIYAHDTSWPCFGINCSDCAVVNMRYRQRSFSVIGPKLLNNLAIVVMHVFNILCIDVFKVYSTNFLFTAIYFALLRFHKRA